MMRKVEFAIDLNATVYAKLNALDNGSGLVISSDGLMATTPLPPVVSEGFCRTNWGATSGSWYYEVDAGSAYRQRFGIISVDADNTKEWPDIAEDSCWYYGYGEPRVAMAYSPPNNGGSGTTILSHAYVSGVLFNLDTGVVKIYDGATLDHTFPIAIGTSSAIHPFCALGIQIFSTYTAVFNFGASAFSFPENIPVGCHIGCGENVPLKA